MMSHTNEMGKFLIWGERGWIAGHLKDLMTRQGKNVHSTAVRMEDQAELCKVLDEIKPTHVINCAGKTGRPNVDWCENHKLETIESNVTGTLVLAKACEERGIHTTVLATGCKSLYMLRRSGRTAEHSRHLRIHLQPRP